MTPNLIQVAGLGEALRCAGHAVDGLSVVAGKGVEQSQLLLEDAVVDWHRAVLSTKAALHKRQEARKGYHEALVEVQRLTAAKHRLQVRPSVGPHCCRVDCSLLVLMYPTHAFWFCSPRPIPPRFLLPQGVIGKEAKLAEAEASLGRAQQAAEEAKRAYEVVCDRFLGDFDRCVPACLPAPPACPLVVVVVHIDRWGSAISV